MLEYLLILVFIAVIVAYYYRKRAKIKNEIEVLRASRISPRQIVPDPYSAIRDSHDAVNAPFVGGRRFHPVDDDYGNSVPKMGTPNIMHPSAYSDPFPATFIAPANHTYDTVVIDEDDGTQVVYRSGFDDRTANLLTDDPNPIYVAPDEPTQYTEQYGSSDTPAAGSYSGSSDSGGSSYNDSVSSDTGSSYSGSSYESNSSSYSSGSSDSGSSYSSDSSSSDSSYSSSSDSSSSSSDW